MTENQNKAAQSGAREVEEREHLGAGMEVPADILIEEREPEEPQDEPVKTELGELTLSMFDQGQSVRVRVGNAHNSSEMYEFAYGSADDANSALLDAGVLAPDQVEDISKPSGTGIALHGVTVQQLEEAGLKRHGSSTL